MHPCGRVTRRARPAASSRASRVSRSSSLAITDHPGSPVASAIVSRRTAALASTSAMASADPGGRSGAVGAVGHAAPIGRPRWRLREIGGPVRGAPSSGNAPEAHRPAASLTAQASGQPAAGRAAVPDRCARRRRPGRWRASSGGVRPGGAARRADQHSAVAIGAARGPPPPTRWCRLSSARPAARWWTRPARGGAQAGPRRCRRGPRRARPSAGPRRRRGGSSRRSAPPSSG